MRNLFTGLLCAALLTPSALAAQSGPLIAPSPSAPAAITVESDGSPLDLRGLMPYEKDGKVMVPVRPVAEALGFTVTWLQEKQGVKLDNGALNTTLFLGVDSYSRASSTALGMGAPQTFGAAPEAADGSTYVPAEFFTVLDLQVSAENGVVDITAAPASVEIPNPMRPYDTLDAAEAALGFTPKLPTPPQGYAREDVFVIGGTVLQVAFTKGDEVIRFRAAQGGSDISGDYNAYPSTDILTLSGLSVTIKGDGQGISLATWSDEGVTYSLSFSTPADSALVETLIASLA